MRAGNFGSISTARLKRLRALHLRPINLVISEGSYARAARQQSTINLQLSTASLS